MNGWPAGEHGPNNVDIVIALDHICSGGGHVRLSATVNGGQPRLADFEAEILRQSLTADDRLKLAELIVRVRCAGLTRAQARSLLETGIEATL